MLDFKSLNSQAFLNGELIFRAFLKETLCIKYSHHLINIKYWRENVDRILEFNEKPLLKDKGKIRNTRKISSPFNYVPRTCRGEPCVRPSYIGTKALLVRGRTQGSPLHRAYT